MLVILCGAAKNQKRESKGRRNSESREEYMGKYSERPVTARVIVFRRIVQEHT